MRSVVCSLFISRTLAFGLEAKAVSENKPCCYQRKARPQKRGAAAPHRFLFLVFVPISHGILGPLVIVKKRYSRGFVLCDPDIASNVHDHGNPGIASSRSAQAGRGGGRVYIGRVLI